MAVQCRYRHRKMIMGGNKDGLHNGDQVALQCGFKSENDLKYCPAPSLPPTSI